MWLMVSAALGGIAVMVGEFLRRQKYVGNEVSRKTIHVAHALTVGSWAFLVDYKFIIAAEIVFLVLVLGARLLHLLQPLRTVTRISYGDIFFPLGVMAIAWLQPMDWVFLAALLHLGLADAFAALAGKRFPKGKYLVFGQRKTLAGSLGFAVFSVLVMAFVLRYSGLNFDGDDMLAFIVVPVAATLAEAGSPYGSDNLTIPVMVVGLLTLFVS